MSVLGGITVSKRVPSFSEPCTMLSTMVTEVTDPASTSVMNWL